MINASVLAGGFQVKLIELHHGGTAGYRQISFLLRTLTKDGQLDRIDLHVINVSQQSKIGKMEKRVELKKRLHVF